MEKTHRINRRLVTAVVTIAAGMAVAAPAQDPPRPPNGTIATEATVKSFYEGAHTIIVATIDGIEHVYQLAKNVVVHDDKDRGPEALKRVSPGTRVVIHYRRQDGQETATEIDVVGATAFQITEGVVSKIDRGRRQLTVRFANGSTQVFQLTENAVEEQLGVLLQSGPDSRIVIYFVEQDGRRVAHYFKRVS